MLSHVKRGHGVAPWLIKSSSDSSHPIYLNRRPITSVVLKFPFEPYATDVLFSTYDIPNGDLLLEEPKSMSAMPQERPEPLAAIELQETDLAMGTAQLPGREVLARETLRILNTRSNRQVLLHFAGHLAAIAVTGIIVYMAHVHWALLIPAMVLHGFAIATLFVPMHECVHRTPFRSKWLNRGVGWITGFGAFINSDYYYRYHHWHHRFTQAPANDPELATPKPRTVAEYVLRISGVPYPYWYGKLRDMLTVSLGRVSHLPFIPAHGRRTVIWSMRIQAALYLLIILSSVLLNTHVLLIYWLLPLLLGQPLLRSITIAEHTHCSEDANGLTNTRTTLTSWPVRFFMWNMPYHAEHHLYPSIPFHALPRAHDYIRERIAHLDHGYIAVNHGIVAKLASASEQNSS